jgi:hypothetical protein
VKDKTPSMRTTALRLLTAVVDMNKHVVMATVGALKDKDISVRKEAVRALSNIHRQNRREIVIQELHASDKKGNPYSIRLERVLFYNWFGAEYSGEADK